MNSIDNKLLNQESDEYILYTSAPIGLQSAYGNTNLFNIAIDFVGTVYECSCEENYRFADNNGTLGTVRNFTCVESVKVNPLEITGKWSSIPQNASCVAGTSTQAITYCY